MNEAVSQEEMVQAIANMSAEEHAFTQEQLEYFFPLWAGEKRKQSIVDGLDERDINFILGVVQIGSIRDIDIEQAKTDVLYCKALKIVEAIVQKKQDGVIEAKSFYSKNLKRTVVEYERKIEGYKISKLPKKKAEQVANLEKKDSEAAQQVINDFVNKDGFKWAKQLKELNDCLDILRSGRNFDISLFSSEALDANPSTAEKVAYALSYPDFQVRFIIQQILESSSPVPHDWYLRHNLSIADYKQMVEEMGQDYGSAANKQYNIACSRINKNASIPVLGIRKRKNLITELFSLLSDGQYESARIVSFVLIEGILWQIVNEVNRKETFILSSENEFVGLSGATFTSTRIRDVIQQTVVSKYVDSDFVEHFCEELYSERNPVLHGGDQCFTCPNAGMCLLEKIWVLDYIIETLIELYKTNLFASWDKMPNDVKGRIMNTVLKTLT